MHTRMQKALRNELRHAGMDHVLEVCCELAPALAQLLCLVGHMAAACIPSTWSQLCPEHVALNSIRAAGAEIRDACICMINLQHLVTE